MDVYSRRFVSRKTGKSGYALACVNEWVPNVCEKPRIKCADCPNRRFLPVTDEVVRWHLSGQDEQGPRIRHGRLSDAPGRNLFLSGGGFRSHTLAGRRDGIP